MKEEFFFYSRDNTKIYCIKYIPNSQLKGVVQIVHGMGENSGRYEHVAMKLVENGYGVYMHDHRGHGKTAELKENLGHLGDGDVFIKMVYDMKEVTDIIKNHLGEISVFLLGHSMGSFLCQKYISLFGKKLSGVMLTGTDGKKGKILDIGIALSKKEIKKHGRKHKSRNLNKICFLNCHLAFIPNRTKFDWLTRDTEEVDKFIEDDFLGFYYDNLFYYYFFKALKDIHKKSVMNKIPKNLPIYIFGGSKDPIGKNGTGLINLYNMYKNIGIKSLTCKIYENGRHEILNEKNKEEVIEDMIIWLNRHM
ncbi:alpha/beta fold hydrolase [Clostridium cochlearium]|uniref:Alpha/beta hydrolase n=1 Tax=Clostridium cochlearium TaxID=1494 RepID=A0A7Y3Y066_CLOCO|nr:alpha/beta hydrolase [Clostridium cochlearium]NOH17015.1 alpha/beta hydrolase [Clostridium cochlearium]